MIFGSLALGEAEGAVLAHTLRLSGRVIKKGTVLDHDAIAALRAAGLGQVIAARLEPGDIGENEAASRLAAALASANVKPSRAGTGRVNLLATETGLFRVSRAAVDRLNAVHEALTLGTLPDATPVTAGEMVATVKIIPFAVPGSLLIEVEARARAEETILAVHPFRPLTAGLVVSELPGLKEKAAQNIIAATEARLAALGGRVLPALRAPHEEAPIADALARLCADGADLLLVAGASAVVDRRDVGPMAILRLGGEIRHFGMPVDPGNLICIGRIGGKPALVLPGCAGSSRPNGIDFVLRLLAAGLDAGPREVMAMGVGGLLKDVPTRGLPRARAVAQEDKPPPEAAPRRPSIAAIVLAAGQSSRMAPHHKLLLPDRAGKPMIARVVDNLLSSPARPILVVVGHRADDIRAALAGRPVAFVPAADYAEGLAASLRAGITALPGEARAALICLGDMPLVTARVIERLIEAYDPDEGRLIAVPMHRGRPGNPVLWDRRFFPEIAALSCDAGARRLLDRHLEAMTEVEMPEDSVLRDFDTVESLASLPERLRPELP